MTTYYDAEGNEIEVDETQALKDARAAAERNEGTAKERDAIAKENALLKALPGVDFDSDLAKMFAKSYDGELEREAIQTAAISVGLFTAAPAIDPTTDVDAELQATREALRTGSAPPKSRQTLEDEAALAVDPRVEGIRAFRVATEEHGQSRQDASAQFFDRHIAAAQRGDERVLWSPEKHRAQAEGRIDVPPLVDVR